MRLDEIQALTLDVIATLPLEQLESLLNRVQTVEVDHPPTDIERAVIEQVVLTAHQSLRREVNLRLKAFCGGTEALYLVIRSVDT